MRRNRWEINVYIDLLEHAWIVVKHTERGEREREKERESKKNVDIFSLERSPNQLVMVVFV